MGMSVGVLDHFNIRTRKLDDTVRFYEDVLGLEKGPAAEFRLPGRLDVQRGQGGGASGRYFQDRGAAKAGFRRGPSRRLRQPGVCRHEAAAGVRRASTTTARQVPGGELWQIFVNDPNGVMIELNYEAAKEQGAGSAPVETREDIGSEVAFCAATL